MFSHSLHMHFTLKYPLHAINMEYTHLFSTFLLHVYCASGIVPDTGDIAITTIDQVPALMRPLFYEGDNRY